MSRTKRSIKYAGYFRQFKTRANWLREDSAIDQLREEGFWERDGQRCLARPSFKAPATRHFGKKVIAHNETNDGRFNTKA